jgi:hypothetical protein
MEQEKQARLTNIYKPMGPLAAGEIDIAKIRDALFAAGNEADGVNGDFPDLEIRDEEGFARVLAEVEARGPFDGPVSLARHVAEYIREHTRYDICTYLTMAYMFTGGQLGNDYPGLLYWDAPADAVDEKMRTDGEADIQRLRRDL